VTQNTELKYSYIKVADLLADQSLRIPEYQRPYKWTTRNVSQLLGDVDAFNKKASYRLGSLVFHLEDGHKNIVDGQQRTLTLFLILRAIADKRVEQLERLELKNQIRQIRAAMIDPSFSSDESHANIYTNWLEILRAVQRPEFTEQHIDFLLNKCEFVVFCLTNISEAFQFFDSQNARGKDLSPHDLLKAYHLREFLPEEDTAKGRVVNVWENSDPAKLVELFARYLFRIRNWTKGMSARFFGKEDIPVFKGVNLSTIAKYPYVEQLRIAHHFIDAYQQSYERQIDCHHLAFPFQLDQIIINGRRFFELVTHYYNLVKHLKPKDESISTIFGISLNDRAKNILQTLSQYEGRRRTGDGYVRSMFDCLLLYYWDKFAGEELSMAIERIFIWAYSLRLSMENVQLASMDNHVLGNNLFMHLKNAVHPSDFFHGDLPVVQTIKSTKTAQIEAVFRGMNYLA